MSSITHTLSGSGAPTMVPPSLNAHYTDTDTKDTYLAVGTDSTADWQKQERDGAAAAAVKAHTDSIDHSQFATKQELSGLATKQELSGKVSAEAGKGLSSNDFTTEEKQKLAGLEGSHFRGVFGSLQALQTAIPSAGAGDYADVDAGAGSDVVRHAWDATDNQWLPQSSAPPLTAAQVKQLYESNPDTNAFTNAEKAKLASLSDTGGGSGGGTAGAGVVPVDAAALALTEAAHQGGYVIAGNASGLTVTVTSQQDGGWSDNASVLIERGTDGPVTFVAAAGVTLRYPKGKAPNVARRYGVVRLQRIAENVWSLSQDLGDYSAPDLAFIASSNGSPLYAFDPNTWSEVSPGIDKTLGGDLLSARQLAISGDRKFLAVVGSGSNSNTSVLFIVSMVDWSVLTKYNDLSSDSMNGGDIISLKFSSDSRYLYFKSGGSVVSMEMGSWSVQYLPKPSVAASYFDVCPSRRHVVYTIGVSPYYEVYNIATGKKIDGDPLAAAPKGVLFDLHTDQDETIIFGLSVAPYISTVYINEPGTSGHSDYYYTSYDFSNIQAVDIIYIELSPDGMTLAVTGIEGGKYRLRLYDMQTMAEITAFPYTESSSRPIFSQDGKLLICNPHIYKTDDWSDNSVFFSSIENANKSAGYRLEDFAISTIDRVPIKPYQLNAP